jgi:membrane protein YdbS with pleckstrin-like domain
VRSLPPVLEVFLRPDRRRADPPPVDVDMRRVALVGLVLWVCALAVAVVLWRLGIITATPVWSCVAGVVLGLLGLVWLRGRR